MRSSLVVFLSIASVLGACSTGGGGDDLGGDASTDGSADAADGDPGFGGDAVPKDVESGTACVAPDMLIALDRTLTMHFRPDGVNPTDAPDYKSSKWSLAVTAIKAFAAPPL